ncbi:MAG: hypothetical protein EA374_04550 [Acholeplasmatales bacterium]|nr:MAG: hypothetical protein EA374_04550 [Acholeplasmatales bacterium]
MKILAAETAIYNVILIVAVMVLIGLYVGRFAERRRIPNITGYLFVGILFGLFLQWRNQIGLLNVFMFLTKFCLGYIAFSIGLELNFKHIWSRRKEVLVVTLVQAVSAFLFTGIGLWVFGMHPAYAFLLGTIAIATEPGPILFLSKRYKTKGALTDTLVPLHGVEDAFAILLFGLVLAYALSVDAGVSMRWQDLLHGPIYELVFSVLIGSVLGLALRFIIRRLDYEDVDKDMVVFVSALVTILTAISLAGRGFHLGIIHVHLSPVLLPMVVGVVFANTSTHLAKHETEHMLDLFSPPILIAFFTMVGAEMILLLFAGAGNLSAMVVLGFATVYIVFRIFGKLFGSYIGGWMAHSERNVRHYLGFCLLPQAQAALGLALYARTQLTDTRTGDLLIVIVVLGTLVYELLGPFGLRHAFIRCHEVDASGTCIVYSKRSKRRASGSE